MARVLLAGDVPDIRALLNFKLELSGHEVVAVSNGADALKACRTGTFDLGIFDVQMPGMSGVQLVAAIRAGDGGHPGLPVALVTALGTPDDKQRARLAGANDYITKPFSLAEFMKRINALLL